MKRIFLLTILLLGSQCLAFDIVYPKKNNVTINAKSTFFIGSSKTPLKINGQNVPLHSSGGFAYVVPLEAGQNVFNIQSGEEKEVFVITKPTVKSGSSNPTTFIQYQEPKYFEVINDISPLRVNHSNSALRISHFQRNVIVKSDGEQAGFYRIVLGNEKFAWMAKSDLKETTTETTELATLIDCDCCEDEKYFTYTYHLDKKVPYQITEGNPFVLKIYNIKDNENNTFSQEFNVINSVGYSAQYCDNDLVVKIRRAPMTHPKKPLKSIKITLDAGHGGYEIGAIGCLGHDEKNVNLEITKLLEQELIKRGAKVFMTRNDDTYIGLKERVIMTNNEDATVFLSIHGNALPDGADPNEHSGTSIYYYYEQAKPLAQSIMNSVVEQTGLNDDKIRHGSYAVVRNTNALSLLIEMAYLINPEDNSKLIDPQFQKQYVKAIADGLENYFKGL